MPFFKFENIKISAMSAAVPRNKVDIDSFSNLFGNEKVQKFQNSTGIYSLRKTVEHQTASDLAYAAAVNLLANKDVSKQEIGALIFGSLSPDYRRPTTACVLHKRLGLSKDCAAFDISLGCSAFVYGITSVCSLMQTSNINKALLLVGETVSKFANPQDSSMAMLFGDGGAAILLEKDNTTLPIYSCLKTDGTGYQAIIAPAGGMRNTCPSAKEYTDEDGIVRNLYNSHMQGANVFAFSISEVPRTIKDFLSKTNQGINDYDCIALHQANKFILQMIAKKLNADWAKFPICLDRYGNTSAPSIPMAICDRYGMSNAMNDIYILASGFGVGLSWGVSSFHVSCADIYPIIETDEIFTEGIINGINDFIKD